MLKPTYINVLLFMLIRYLLFFAFLMVRFSNYNLVKLENLINGGSFTYFLLVMLPFPIIDMVLFSAPLFFSIKSRKLPIVVMVLAIMLVADYVIYVYLTSQKTNDIRAMYNVSIGLMLFVFFFFRSIKGMVQKPAR